MTPTRLALLPALAGFAAVFSGCVNTRNDANPVFTELEQRTGRTVTNSRPGELVWPASVSFEDGLVLRGAEERLAPILMTAACAALALLSLVLKGTVPGHEIEYPMAVVILGGLATSTLLNLFLMPSLYCRFGRSRATTGTELRPEHDLGADGAASAMPSRLNRTELEKSETFVECNEPK